jgi:hypothetical protein
VGTRQTQTLSLESLSCTLKSDSAKPRGGGVTQRHLLNGHRQAEGELPRRYLDTTFTELMRLMANLPEVITSALRFIEVKGRAQTGGVVLTAPEVDKLRQLGDRAFLYIVTFCKGEKPRLRIIQDPMANLHPAMLYRQVQYFVDEADWQQHGDDLELPLTG